MLSVLPDAVVTTLGTPVTIHVLANDGGSGLTVTSFSNPAHGNVTFNADQSFTYTPTAGFAGADSFAYTVRDAQGTPSGAEVTITVAPNDGATRATADYVEMIAGGAVVIPVLDNDLTAAGPLQLIAISVPGHGATNVLASQSIRYVPQTGFVGIDSFIYTVIDAAGTTTGATVTVKVLAQNSPPLAEDDAFTLEAGETTVLAILANDSDPDGGPLQVVSYTMPDHGSLVFNPDKTFSYTPAAGYQGVDQFTYTIRDNRGGSASAGVRLTIVETAARPVAADDHVATEAGVPVTIDVLGNDELPAGQEIRIVAVTLPFKGSLVFNPNGTITYTPNAGFVGFDDFTYTIGNGLGGTAKATVTVEVTATALVETYANGYGYRRRVVVPAQLDSAVTMEDGVVLFSEQGDWLKSSANGGKVASAAGFDIRFELANGSKLDHEIETYDPVDGRLLAWIRLPIWTLSSQFQLLFYYGNAAMAMSEANPAGVWKGYLARWRLPDGSDATGSGRELVAQGVAPGVASESPLRGAARFDGNSSLSSADALWLVDLSALTMQALIKADAGMIGTTNGILVQGSPDSNDAAEGIMLRYLAEASTGAENVLHVRVGCLDGNSFALSSADQQTDKHQLIHSTWLAANAPELYLNGTKNTPSRSVARSGRTSGAGPLYVGAGWQGLIDEVRLAGRSLPADWIAVEARNMLAPELSYGLGHEETINTVDFAPIAIPFAVSTTSGKFLNIDVLSQAAGPDGLNHLMLVSVTQPAHGMATVIDGLVRYTPDADFVGTDRIIYTISDGAQSASGRIGVTVSAPSAPQNDSGVTLPSAQRTVNVSSQSQFDAALSAAVTGDHIVLANGTYTGPGNWTKSGTQAHPIVVRAANLLGARITGSFSPNGSDLILHGLDFQAAQVNVGATVQSNRVRLWRCRWRDYPAPSTAPALRTYQCSDLDVAYCEWTNWAGRGISFGPAAGTRQPRVRRCLFRNTPAGFSQNATEAIQIGFGNKDRPIACEALIELCRFTGWNSDDETISVKSSGNSLRLLTFENNSGRCGNRMGMNNLYEAISFKGSSGIRIHDKGNLVLGCDVTQAGQGLRIAMGDHDADTTMTTNNTPNAGNVHVSGCIGTVTIAHAFTGHSIQARNTRLRQHAGTVTLASGTHTGTDSQPAVAETLYSWTAPLWLNNADVGPTADLG